MDAEVNADELEFRFVAGHRALDLLATLGNRHQTPVERLREPGDLDRWLAGSGLTLDEAAAPRDLRNACELREALNRVTRAFLASEQPAEGDLETLNDWASRPSLAPLADESLRRQWSATRPVTAALALVAREAVELLTGPDRTMIRECAAAPRCSLLYLDRSRAGRRRWCEMERCGSRAKMAAYRGRSAPAPTSDARRSRSGSRPDRARSR